MMVEVTNTESQTDVASYQMQELIDKVDAQADLIAQLQA